MLIRNRLMQPQGPDSQKIYAAEHEYRIGIEVRVWRFMQAFYRPITDKVAERVRAAS